ncbi:MAG: site-2 protease family protein [Clostridia bacterium]|nr:site-2 protease family protein [Clostridia bacterium]
MPYNSSMFSRLEYLFNNPLELLYMLPALLLSLTVHEWGHAYVAYRCGDPTARNLGRMTLNPLAHFDIFGTLCLLVVGFGWAKPVPVNSRNFRHPKRDEILVSLAGVTMNLMLLIVSMCVFAICLRINARLIFNEALMGILTYFMAFNATLMIFNLIPIPPLDGSHILEIALVRHVNPKFFYYFRRYGMFILLALLWFNVLDVPLAWAQNTVFDLAIKMAGLG